MHQIILFVTLLFSTSYSWANIVINGTRIIFMERNEYVTIQLINNGDAPALVQSWIDDGNIDSTPETSKVPFLLSPPVVKVLPHNGQQLRIKKLPANLLKDRESVFFLNVLDIPPVPANLRNQNTVQLAVKSRIKLFYRPETLTGSLVDAVSKVKLISENKGIRIINDSPLHITIVNIESPKKNKLLAEPLMISPLSQHFAPAKGDIKASRTYDVMYVDDSGAYKTQTITSQ